MWVVGGPLEEGLSRMNIRESDPSRKDTICRIWATSDSVSRFVLGPDNCAAKAFHCVSCSAVYQPVSVGRLSIRYSSPPLNGRPLVQSLQPKTHLYR